MSWSYWERNTFFKHQNVLIIGAGIVGLSTAIALKKANSQLEVTVLDRGVLPSGASTKNAGFACFGSISELVDDLKNSGRSEVLSLVEKRWKGLQFLMDQLGANVIDYQGFGSYEIFTDKDDLLHQECLSYLEDFNRDLTSIIGAHVFESVDEKMQDFGLTNCPHLIANRYEGQIDTGKMMKALLSKARALDVNVMLGLSVKRLTEKGVLTENDQELTADQIVLTTNGFASQLMDVDVKPARAQVMVTKPIDNLKIKGCFHYDKGYYYFRNVHDRLLIGGGRNVDFEGEETFDMENTGLIMDAIKQIVDQNILRDQVYEVDYAWSGIMGVGDNKSPIVKRIDDRTIAGVKLGGMGVAIGSLIGVEVAELVLEGVE